MLIRTIYTGFRCGVRAGQRLGRRLSDRQNPSAGMRGSNRRSASRPDHRRADDKRSLEEKRDRRWSAESDRNPGRVQIMSGCPRHPGGNRDCPDARCEWTWEPEGAPSGKEQIARWVAGESICPNKRHECCPDFSCCRPELGWPLEKRAKFAAATQGEREKMMMGALSGLAAESGEKAYVTRGGADRS